ncbi:MAG: tripartite tricarboxylate transporter substrate-binding protein, partial [Deltaproteobacteria bacterium]|nr:tripartite tricarboxylate transporter substrate-binding protein [Deltaproteobacteria bacterium]
MDVGFQDIPTAKSQMAAGNVRLLAFLGPDRDEDYPNVPTLKELGYNVDISVLRPILAAKGLPKPVLAKLVQAIGDTAQNPDFVKFSRQQDTIPLWMPEEKGLRAFDEQEQAFRPVLKEADLLKEAK